MAKKTVEEIIKENNINMTCTLDLDDGSTMECAVIKIFRLFGKRNTKQYIALQPVEEYGDPEGSIFIYRYETGADGEPALGNIDNDEEFDNALQSFADIMDAELFDYVPDDAE